MKVEMKKKSKIQLVKKIASNTISTILFITLVFTAFVVVSTKASVGEPQVFGHQIKTVLSGSMEPTFNTGSIIAVKANVDPLTLKEGDIITFRQDEQTVVTHRIMEVLGSGDTIQFKTKGDNNEDPDTSPVLAQNVIAIYSGFTIPYVGYLIDLAKSQMGGALLLIIPGVLLLIYSGVTIWRALSQIEVKDNSKQTKEADESA